MNNQQSNQHLCSECGNPLNVYQQGGKTVAECTQQECCLYMVTRSPEALLSLSGDERTAYAEINARWAQETIQREQEKAAKEAALTDAQRQARARLNAMWE